MNKSKKKIHKRDLGQDYLFGYVFRYRARCGRIVMDEQTSTLWAEVTCKRCLKFLKHKRDLSPMFSE